MWRGLRYMSSCRLRTEETLAQVVSCLTFPPQAQGQAGPTDPLVPPLRPGLHLGPRRHLVVQHAGEPLDRLQLQSGKRQSALQVWGYYKVR